MSHMEGIEDAGLHEQQPAAAYQDYSGDGGEGNRGNHSGGTGPKNRNECEPDNGGASESGDSGMGGENGSGHLDAHTKTGDAVCTGGREFRTGTAEAPADGAELPVQRLKYYPEVLGDRIEIVKNQYGYNGPTDDDGVLNFILDCEKQQLFHFFRQGAALLYLKEKKTEWGDFLKSLEKIDMEPRRAQEVMSATMRLCHLYKAGKLDGLSKTSVLELNRLKDEPLKQLETSGSVLDIKLDELDKTPVRELRKKVKETNHKIESLERLVDKLNEEKQELLDENYRLSNRDSKTVWTEQAKQILEEIPKLNVQLDQIMAQMKVLVTRSKELDEHYPDVKRSIYKKFTTLFDELSDHCSDFADNLLGLQPIPNVTLNDLDEALNTGEGTPQ